MTALAMLTSFLNWGFSLIFSALLARALARSLAARGIRVDYRALAAAKALKTPKTPKGADKPNEGTFLWSVSPFPATLACAADLNVDGFVDDADFVIFAAAYEDLISPIGDFNGDDFTDDADFVIFAAAYEALLACP